MFAVLRTATGIDFTYYKQSTIQRRIARRQFLLKTPDLQSYAKYLADQITIQRNYMAYHNASQLEGEAR